MEATRSSLPLDPLCWRDLDPASFRILFADDHAGVRAVLQKSLRSEGYRIGMARDGQELLEECRREPPDLVVLDVMMPRLDGLAALAELRSDPRLASTYVILLTARSSLEDKVQGLDCGADDYLTKPFQLAELLARVRAGIRLKGMGRLIEESQQIVIRQEKLATIGQLASGIAHEFNNIMGAITGFAQLALTHESYRERLAEVALSQAERVQRITSSLSTFATGSSWGLRSTTVAHLVDSSICLVQKELAQRGIGLEVDVEPDLPAIRVDLSQMQQALVHLLLNASQAAEEAGSVAVRAYRLEEGVCIEIDDDGPGIPEELHHRVFDPFFTTKGALGSSEIPGTGLGLAFSHNIAERHRGQLRIVTSSLGGACLRVVLPPCPEPAGTPAEELIRSATPTTPDGGEGSNRPVIVLVEDDPHLQEVVRELLGDPSPSVFSQGPEAVQHCTRHRVDVLILDLNLEGPWDGARVLEELARTLRPPQVILTTGSLDPDPLPDGALTPAVVLRKPYSLTELERAIASLCGEATDGS